jgi:hypothetical protein
MVNQAVLNTLSYLLVPKKCVPEDSSLKLRLIELSQAQIKN